MAGLAGGATSSTRGSSRSYGRGTGADQDRGTRSGPAEERRHRRLGRTAERRRREAWFREHQERPAPGRAAQPARHRAPAALEWRGSPVVLRPRRGAAHGATGAVRGLIKIEALEAVRRKKGDTVGSAELLNAVDGKPGFESIKNVRRLAALLNPLGIVRRQLWNGGARRWCYVLDAGQLTELRARYGG